MNPIDLLPEAQARDVRAVRSMSTLMEVEPDPKVRQDLSNRITQAMGRLADWEGANPDLAKQVAAAAVCDQAQQAGVYMPADKTLCYGR